MAASKKKGFSKDRLIPAGIGLICSCAILILWIILSNSMAENSPFARLDSIMQNGFFFFRNNHYSVYGKDYGKIAIVQVDEKTLGTKDAQGQKIYSWPFPRSMYVKLIQKLEQGGAKTILFDILFVDRSSLPGEDEKLARGLAKTNKVILIGLFVPEADGVKLEPPLNSLIASWSAAQQKSHIGYTYEKPDIDGITRTFPMLTYVDNQPVYSMDILALCHFLGEPVDKIQPTVDNIKFGAFSIPTEGNKVNINYYIGGSESKIKGADLINYISFSDVMTMTPEEAASLFKDKLVIIGVTATAGEDIKHTPLGVMPGVEIHANILLSILEGKYLTTQSRGEGVVLMFLLGILLAVVLPYFSPQKGGIIALGLIVGVGFWGLYAFLAQHTLVSLAPLQLNILLTYASVTIHAHQKEQRTRQRLRTMVEEFAPLPEQLLDSYLSNQKKTQAQGEKAVLSILFSDIRGFTTLSERLDSGEVMSLINDFHTAMGKIFDKYGGIIFTYIGDSQMVVFGIKEESKANHGAQAALAGLEMQEGVEKLREKWLSEGRETIKIGVGVATGEVSIGVVGGSQRRQYTVLGDTVNLAARLESLTKELNSLVNISEATYAMAKNVVDAELVENVKVKGKLQSVPVYKVLGRKI